MKTTRQGVRDLNAPGVSNPSRRKTAHRHFFAGPFVVVGYRSVPGDWFGDIADPVYAQQCLHCSAHGPTR